MFIFDHLFSYLISHRYPLLSFSIRHYCCHTSRHLFLLFLPLLSWHFFFFFYRTLLIFFNSSPSHSPYQIAFIWHDMTWYLILWLPVISLSRQQTTLIWHVMLWYDMTPCNLPHLEFSSWSGWLEPSYSSLIEIPNIYNYSVFLRHRVVELLWWQMSTAHLQRSISRVEAVRYDL